jgi:polar amino acid transport system substrate-binding protein
MHQLTQQLKSGNMEILEVPFPILGKGQVLVRNLYSVISAGTESKTVSDARKGYIAKARSRQKEVRQVIEMIKSNGFMETYNMVMNKLEAPSPLGYSSAGEVIAVGPGVSGFKVGDKVACGGSSAIHAEVIAVPVNLCVRLPEKMNLREAALTTVASIAIQGIRQADLQFGHNCVVIGLGLIGQLTMQVLNASGIKAIGIDIAEDQVAMAKKGGCTYVFNRNKEGLEPYISELTGGLGADAVIITAGTSSLDPVEFAGRIARKKARVVIVGAVPTGFSREHYYKKELDLRMSSSYGPGRYDPQYEEKGIDYPAGYVRFTENRNMQSFVDLVAAGKLKLDYLITHEFELPEAPLAYSMILEKSEPFAGILLRYDEKAELVGDIALVKKNFQPGEPNVGFVGAGNFAQNMLLPRMKGLCNFVSIATIKGNESVYVAKKYGFSRAYDTAEKVIADNDVNTVFVVTRHDAHANYVMESLKAGKHVYVEKPLAMNENELANIQNLYNSSSRQENAPATLLMVGFNRRFSPAVKKIKSIFLAEQPKAINIRINAGNLPPEHWVNDPEFGGGRIIGEACHFIDLAMFLAGSSIKSVFAKEMKDPDNLSNTLSITLDFDNGSVAGITYFSNGSKKLPKESIEVFCGGTVAVINDFKSLQIFSSTVKKLKFSGQDKGHAEQLKLFLDAVRNGTPCPVPFTESFMSMLATFKVLESLRSGRAISLKMQDQ